MLFHVPYRWIPRCWWSNLSYIYHDLTSGVANVFRWIPVIWFDRDFDWGYLNRILIYKFSRMAKVMEHGHLVGRARTAKQLRICAELCRRMERDEYFEIAAKRYPERGKAWAQMVGNLGRQDQALLGKLIGKYYTHWWD